jgi:hypothetical protein
MMQDGAKVTGKITARVYGHTKRGLRRIKILRFFGLLSSKRIESLFQDPRFSYLKQESVSHNIVTDDGDAMIADLMSQTPALQKLDNTHGFIQCGTGWSATNAKAQTWVHTATGPAKALSATYPKLKGTFGNANDNVVQFQTAFVAADFGSVTLNEAVLSNANADVGGQAQAYGNINPSVVITAADSMTLLWEITLLGT